MIFGNSETFAIEIGAVEMHLASSGLFVQFRFWIGKVSIGDWNDRISLIASIENAHTIHVTEQNRLEFPFFQSNAAEVFYAVYDKFFSYDYTKDPVLVPNLRDRFHLDEIGMGAIQDKYGIVLVASSDAMERIIVKDLRQEKFIADIMMPLGFVEAALMDYIEWGRSQLLARLPPNKVDE